MIEDVVPEIQRSVEAKLVRYGAVGKVVIDGLGQTISLMSSRPPATLPIGALAVRWKEIAFEERERECSHLARSLLRAQPPLPPSPVQRRAAPYFALAVCGGLLLAGSVAYRKLRMYLVERAAAAARQAAQEMTDPDAERQAHAAQVCNATRARLSHGGTVGPADTEGWVVELALVRPASEPAWPPLTPFLALAEGAASGHVNWAGAPSSRAWRDMTRG